MIAIVDLRLIGFGAKGTAITDIYRDVIPLTWAAFVVAAISGVLLFISQAMEYYANIGIRLKFSLLALIAVNMLVFRWVLYPGISKWDRDAPVPLAAKLAGAISLVSWISVVAAARWIAYLML
jgi:CBS domain containing-hemolysin-like protein